MAKQDLVVKLLLDSGAFGQDIREAERKAKEFSNNMKSAGDTAGKFTNEIGLSTGAIGKFSSVLTGAGGVVAAIGAFKSVMMSTHETSKQFQGTIAGFEGVLQSFQQSLAGMDFTSFTNGIGAVIESAKQAKMASMESALGKVVYKSLLEEHLANIKKYRLEFIKATSDEARKQWKEMAKKEAEIARNELSNLAVVMDADVISNVIAGNGAFKGHNITTEFAEEQLRIVKKYINDRTKDVDIAAYEEFANKLAEIDRYITTAQQNAASALLMSENNPFQARKFIEQANKYEAQVKAYTTQKEKLIADNLDLIFRHQLYDLPVDALSDILSKMSDIDAQYRQLSEVESEILGWNGSSTPKTTTTNKIELKAMDSSITKLKEQISAQEKLRNTLIVGSEEWLDATTVLHSYNRQLERTIELQKKLDSKFDTSPILPNLSASVMGENSGKIVLPTPKLPTGDNKEGDGSDVIKQWTSQLADMNMVATSSISILQGLGSAFAACGDESSKALSGLTNMMTSITSGILGYIQVQQAYTTATGLSGAAGLPFPYNLAAMTTVMGTVLSLFANIRSMVAGKFAEGGIVGGTSYSGDKLFAMVNSGEMILNKRQQTNLGNMLGGGQVEFYISGDSLVGVLNNSINKRKLTR